MNKLFVVILLWTVQCNGQNLMSFCITNPNISDQLENITTLSLPNNQYTIRVFVHIIRKTDGSGGVSLNNVNVSLNYLKQAFEPHGICISLYGIDEIYNDNFYYTFNLGLMNAYTNTNNAIDIFIGDSNYWNAGQASGIPGKAMGVGGNLFGSILSLSYVIAHEMGHCLGLYHTFHGLCESGCAEFVNGSNCTTCGDYVCDTPADPQQFQVINTGNGCFCSGTTCGVPNTDVYGNYYNPDENNIMAYTLPSCMQYFTHGQGLRMRYFLANSSILQPVIVPDNYTIYLANFAFNDNKLFAVNNQLIVQYSTFMPNSHITLKAGNEIVFMDEFRAESEMEAYIDSFCSIVNETNSAKQVYETTFRDIVNVPNKIFLIKKMRLIERLYICIFDE